MEMKPECRLPAASPGALPGPMARLMSRLMSGAARIPALSLVLVGLPVAGPAQSETCYAGGAEQGGRLEFRGAVEGSGFSGRFEAFSVLYCMPDAAPEAGTIEVSVELASANSRNRDRDQALVGEEFFHVERFPISTWSSHRIEREASGYFAEGVLELKGVRADQAVRFELSPDGDELIAAGHFVLDGTAEVDRQRFGVGTGEFADPDFVRDRIELEFEVALQRRD